ncbi:hypothetical protein JK386_01740 [Nocardioides sp. zg-536]|uniref:Uncharacterized protein n=1 Tax=Nocardioides faecalis TaxID=2803858 RepID=A0A938Y6X3_9ACTN|nr:hypothetical protein [Nocardioides faecalis]MBM9458616.1 hypothetical protein [Nocardioides faecalis]MBS4752948.1 hypothetical protein [Nocardioides faecalis]QVI60776.1 hypothetical protein KG111_16830 [Nocardioides faecalis]
MTTSTTPVVPGSTARHPEPVGTRHRTEDAVARAARRDALRDRHAQRLLRLMAERSDLRGVHPLADFVDDAVRWSA